MNIRYTVTDNFFDRNLTARLFIESSDGFPIEEKEMRLDIPPNVHLFQWDGSNLRDMPVFDGTYRYAMTVADPAGNVSERVVGEADGNVRQVFVDRVAPVTDIVMEMNHRQGVKPMVKRVIIPKIDDRRQKRLVGDTIDVVLLDS